MSCLDDDWIEPKLDWSKNMDAVKLESETTTCECGKRVFVVGDFYCDDSEGELEHDCM